MKRTASKLIAAFVLILLSALCYLPLAAHGQNITLVGKLNPFVSDYTDVWGEGDYAYLGTHQGVAIIDISDPTLPFLVATYSPPTVLGTFTEVINDVKVHGGIGYFPTSRNPGVHIVNLSDPTMPFLISEITSEQNGHDRVHNVFYSNGYLYEANNASPIIKVFDVSDPNRPFFVRDIMTRVDEEVHDVTVINDRLYASGIGLGLTYIYDIRSIESVAPSLLAIVATGSETHSSWVSSDGSLMISAQEGGASDVRIYDLSDLQDPLLLSSLRAPALGIRARYPHNPVLFSDDLLFVSWLEAGGVAIDISNPSDPLLAGRYQPGKPSATRGVWGVYPLLGLDRVLLSDRDNGLLIVDATCAALLRPQDKDQQRCINELNKNFRKVVRAQLRDIYRCIKEGADGNLVGITIEECLRADREGKVARAKQKTIDRAAQECVTLPDLGATNAATVGSAAAEMELDLVHEIFGADLDAAIINPDDPSRSNAKAESRCQAGVLKSVRKCQDAKLKEFNRCTKTRLRSNTCASGFTACMGEDPKGRIARACGPPPQKCLGLGVSNLFAGCNTGSASELAACLDVLVKCQLCVALNQADNLVRDCDEFDDGVVNGSCP